MFVLFFLFFCINKDQPHFILIKQTQKFIKPSLLRRSFCPSRIDQSKCTSPTPVTKPFIPSTPFENTIRDRIYMGDQHSLYFMGGWPLHEEERRHCPNPLVPHHLQTPSPPQKPLPNPPLPPPLPHLLLQNQTHHLQFTNTSPPPKKEKKQKRREKKGLGKSTSMTQTPLSFKCPPPPNLPSPPPRMEKERVPPPLPKIKIVPLYY